MKELLSPKQVARAIGVSESSVKRWCDKGVLATERTAGGHRRVRADEALRFIREQGYTIAAPDVLGLPSVSGQGEWTTERAEERFRQALIDGADDVCRQVVLDLHLAKRPIPVICDSVIAQAFHNIGDMWDCGEVEVYEERRACEICLRVVHELRQRVASPPQDAPIAFGATLDGDPYTLAVSMAELVLRVAGWNAMSLGHMLPFDTLRKAIEQHSPKLVWLSVSAVRDETRFVAEFNQLFEHADKLGAAIAVGGVALTPEIRRQIRFSAHCETFQHLEDFARVMLK